MSAALSLAASKTTRHENTPKNRNQRKTDRHVFRISDYEKLNIELVTEHDRRVIQIEFDRNDDSRFEVNLVGASGEPTTMLIHYNLPG